jgi:hypothetical protein
MKDITLLPADYRKRAERCRSMAERAPATRDEFLIAAATWDVLADHAESLLRYEKKLKDTT